VKNKFMDDKGFRFTSTKVERLQEAMMRNSILESSPCRKTITNETSEMAMNLRPREEKKELSRSFRFKATSQAERIAETVAINLREN